MEIGSDFNLNIKKENNLFFASGRIAIKNILDKFIKNKNDKCLVPNYLCDSIFYCFTNFEFYKINNELNIDIEYLKDKIQNNSYKLIFIINYFGKIDKNINIIKNLCKNKNILIIEDFTHNLYSTNLYGDVSICSYRKTLATPFGAIVIDQHNLLKIKQKSYFNLKYLFYNLLKINGMLFKNIHYFKFIWYPLLKYCENNLKYIDYNGFDYMNYLFYKYYYDSDNRLIRLNNYKLLNETLKYKSILNENLYFTYPMYIESNEKRDKIRELCSIKKLYCPIYWPLNFDKENKCNHYISNHILCIPIDQRYDKKNMNFIINLINNL